MRNTANIGHGKGRRAAIASAASERSNAWPSAITMMLSGSTACGVGTPMRAHARAAAALSSGANRNRASRSRFRMNCTERVQSPQRPSKRTMVGPASIDHISGAVVFQLFGSAPSRSPMSASSLMVSFLKTPSTFGRQSSGIASQRTSMDPSPRRVTASACE